MSETTSSFALEISRPTCKRCGIAVRTAKQLDRHSHCKNWAKDLRARKIGGKLECSSNAHPNTGC
jgi:hypothetical protein